MIKRATKEDIPFVNSVLGDDSVFPFASDDYTDVNIRWKAGEILLNRPEIWVLISNEYTVFVLNPLNPILYEVHTSILTGGRGRKGIEAGKETIAWFFNNSPAQKIISFIPEFNRPARIYARACGMKKEGVVTKSYFKFGKLHDQIIVGIEKEQ